MARVKVSVVVSFGRRMRSLSPIRMRCLHFRWRGQNLAGQNLVRAPQQSLPEHPSLGRNFFRFSWRACFSAELYSAKAPHVHTYMKRCICFRFPLYLVVSFGSRSRVCARLCVQRSRSAVVERVLETVMRPRRMSATSTGACIFCRCRGVAVSGVWLIIESYSGVFTFACCHRFGLVDGGGGLG